MKKKTVSRLSAMFMAGAMMVATFGMSVCAADAVTSVPVTKTITADTNVKAPNTTFNFTVAPASEDTKLDDGTVVYAGVEGGAFFAEDADSIAFKPGDVLIKNTNISLDSSVFTKPGVYRYVVSETEGIYDGMAYTKDTYNLDVYVENDGNGFKIAGVTVGGVAVGTGKAGNAAFTNVYTTNDLTVTKNVTGNQGDKDKDFEFEITVTGSDAGETYTMYVNNVAVADLKSGEKATFTLKHGQSAVIYGLSANDTYVVTEKDYSSDGYTTTIGSDKGNTSTGKIAADTTITVVNDKDVNTPTGIIASYAPYILMVVVAGAAVVLFLRRRNRAEF